MLLFVHGINKDRDQKLFCNIFFKLNSANFSPINLEASQVRPVESANLIERSKVEHEIKVVELVSSIICA
jgi:hypothetical protein